MSSNDRPKPPPSDNGDDEPKNDQPADPND